MAPKTRANTGALKRTAYDELKRRLMAGEYAPGALVSERRLAQELGMSKTPVHAALERLEAERFVAAAPQQGFVVLDLSVEEIVDHYELREAIEGFVLRRLAGRLTPEQAAQLKENLRQQDEAVQAEDTQRTLELDSEMHLMLCRFFGNRQINNVMLHQRDRIHRVILRVWEHDRERLAKSPKEHRRLVNAVIKGDGELAASLLAKHLEAGKRSILLPRRR